MGAGGRPDGSCANTRDTAMPVTCIGINASPPEVPGGRPLRQAHSALTLLSAKGICLGLTVINTETR